MYQVLMAMLAGLMMLQIGETWVVDGYTSLLVDQFGRFRIFHGLNTVYKQFPYYPSRNGFNSNDSLVIQDFIRMRDWGVNAIRLYIAWEGFQTSHHEYNYTYLQTLKVIIRQAQQYNISVILDAHQDLYSKRYCGEGFPVWFTKHLTFPQPLKVQLRYDKNGNPLKQDCMKISFFKYYATYDVMQFQNDFFTNKNGMLDQFIEMWGKVVSFFLTQNNVLGYDVLNQPSGANAWKNPYNFFGPAVDNNRYLLPFYKRLSQQIRQIDTKRLILFEPSPADYFGGFFNAPSQPPFRNRDILSYHTYCPLKNLLGSTICKLINVLYMQKRADNVHKLRIGKIMTEFGSVGNNQAELKQLSNVLQLSEQNFDSWFYWQYKWNADSTTSTNPPWDHSFFNPNGSLQFSKVKTLAHPYVYALCGDPISQTHKQKLYILKYIPLKCLKRTELYLNEDMYFDFQFEVNFSPACPKCKLRQIRKSYYEVYLDKHVMFRPLTIKIVGYI